MPAPRDFDIVLVLSGGNALGAFEAGAFEVLHARGLQPDWVVGTSIGALNGALIAGTPSERRAEALRSFWRVAPPERGQADHRALPFPFSQIETWRRSEAAAWTVAAGRPGLFGPFLSAMAPWAVREPSLFETGQMLRTLERLVDFERLNKGACRYSATAVDLESGEDVIFDSRRHTVDARHVQASAALPVLFPPVEIAGRWHVDGGLSANLPLDPVFAEPPARPMLCIAVDLVPLRRPRPRTLGEIASRSQDLIFATQSRRSIARWQSVYAGRDDVQATLLRIAYERQGEEIAAKAFDFSEPTVGKRWRDGMHAMEAALLRLPDACPLQRRGLTLIDGEGDP
ncbi:patatin-like phospholipase family protein [Aureimonas sp. SK2]|uniref:patatin-like phospholipase family protein n=1 Tax=Aureimonas sp. SK2 TaxID=3015992 RepID=UPI0024442615|nr:patatin-like phospholipase family protein [Aureimonas sp. SK2]